MKKRSSLKMITIATGLAVGVAGLLSGMPDMAFASPTVTAPYVSYLSAPILSTTQVNLSYVPVVVETTVQTVNGPVHNYYLIYSQATSLFGNTIPSTTQLGSFLSANYNNSLQTLSYNGITYSLTGYNSATIPSNVTIAQVQDGIGAFVDYTPTSQTSTGNTIDLSGFSGCSNCTLDLKLLDQISTPTFQTSLAPGATGQTYGGSALSNVYEITGGNMPGYSTGDLVFSYQFDVTSQTSGSNNVGATQASVSFWDNPNGNVYTLGSGGIDTSSLSGSQLSCSTCTSEANFITSISGTASYNSLTGGIVTLTYTSNNTLGVGTLTPQVFVASNATTYTIGSLAIEGNGSSATVDVFTPGTPEPGTLVLFGTALGLVAFMVVRNRRSQSVA